jgi:uncharacterized protein YbgA (DUF1722 family)/uncharacterized protein YbbK (DUF523 family)
MTKPKVGISACLLGENVRYDGGHKREPFLSEVFGRCVEWLAVCPELEAGMGVPREPVRLVALISAPKLLAEKSGTDWTAAMNDFAARRIAALKQLTLSGYIFKKDSPSCGVERVRVYRGAGAPRKDGRGLFAAALIQALPLLPVEEEGRLHDPKLRENFIDRVFAYQRWQDLGMERKSLQALVRFHTRHKLLLLAHSERHYRELGRLVAASKEMPSAEVYREYGRLFMAALAIHATPKQHANVLEHMLGYFSGALSPSERREIVELINEYRHRLIPLIVPITLIRHFVNKYGIEYLQQQVYFVPSPPELMLRNYV